MMDLCSGFEIPPAARGGFVAIGNFDGVHRGHRSMAAELVRQARETNVPAVVFTFEPHPIALLRPDRAPPRLTTAARRAELLRGCGVDQVLTYPTSPALLELTPEEFFEKIIREALQARGLVEGPNFFFGRDRSGNIETLRNLCNAAGMRLSVVAPVTIDGQIVSSSAVRKLIAAGEVQRAAEALGQPYQIAGTVVQGSVRGRGLGFPTANLAEIATLLPGDGVYAARSAVNGRTYAAAVSIGPNPTFAEDARKVEVHLLDFAGDLYGRTLAVDFVDRIREIRTFAGMEELQQQLRADVEQTRKLVTTSAVR